MKAKKNPNIAKTKFLSNGLPSRGYAAGTQKLKIGRKPKGGMKGY